MFLILVVNERLVEPPGNAPGPSDFQSAAITLSAKAPLIIIELMVGFEPTVAGLQPAALTNLATSTFLQEQNDSNIYKGIWSSLCYHYTMLLFCQQRGNKKTSEF